MATKINLTLGSSTDLTALESTLDSTLGSDEILSEQATGPTEQTTIDDTTEVVATRYLADTVDPTNTVDSLQTEYPDATIDTSWTGREYQQDQYADDPDYYPYTRSTGLRTPVKYTNSDGYTLGVDTAVVVGDVESLINDSVDFDPVTEAYTRRDRVVTDGNTIEILQGTAVEEPAKTGVLPEPPETPTDHVSLVIVTLKEHIDRITHGGIEVEPLVEGL